MLPKHTILNNDKVNELTREKLQDSLVVVHGGMAQDVGPILEMLTEKYLLRSEKEWFSRKEAIEIYSILVEKLESGDIKGLGSYTNKNFDGPIQSIIPWASNKYTELIIAGVKEKFGTNFWGFWMLGGMAGGTNMASRIVTISDQNLVGSDTDTCYLCRGRVFKTPRRRRYI